jgi:hypothetical protein
MAGAYSQQQLELKFNAISERLANIEAQLKVLSDKAGVSYEEPFAELPPDVLELARAGQKMEAAKLYREPTAKRRWRRSAGSRSAVRRGGRRAGSQQRREVDHDLGAAVVRGLVDGRGLLDDPLAGADLARLAA